MKHVLPAATMLLLICNLSVAQFNYDRYKHSTPSLVRQEHIELIQDSIDVTIAATNLHYRFGLTYGDSLRPLDSMSFRVIDLWIRSIVHREVPDSMYQYEVLLYLDTEPLWFPIQSQLIPFMHEELKEGDPIFVYLNLMGATKTRLVFSINEFQKIE